GWFSARYHAIVDADELRPLLRPEIEALMLELAHRHYRGAALAEDLDNRLAAAGLAATVDKAKDQNGAPPEPAAIAELVRFAQDALDVDIDAETLAVMTPGQVRSLLVARLDAKCRPEMREMEKAVLLQILDSSWMEHPRAMDHLRSSIGLQG